MTSIDDFPPGARRLVADCVAIEQEQRELMRTGGDMDQRKLYHAVGINEATIEALITMRLGAAWTQDPVWFDQVFPLLCDWHEAEAIRRSPKIAEEDKPELLRTSQAMRYMLTYITSSPDVLDENHEVRIPKWMWHRVLTDPRYN